ncbi:MAG: IS66 family insertion sequence element accessory protein TnpB [Rhodanobacteraceae bacterium]|nr:IS66 family insertion sequence element accessory protein TnpB [Rhodanobacteraceae bacterium]
MLAKQLASGLSVAAFCAQERLNAASFYQWRSRLGNDARRVLPAASAGNSFVDLGALSGSSRVELRIELGGGLVVQLVRG